MGSIVRVPLAILLATCLFAAPAELSAQQTQKSQPMGQFMTVRSPIDDTVAGRVQNAALELQNKAVQADREAVLVLEITAGTSRFGQVRDLAKFLASARLSKVRTVAWIPGTVTGNNVIVALACSEIIMHPDARLGDIGRGERVDDDEQQFVISLVSRKHNRMVTPSLARGMMNPELALMRVEIGREDGSRETQILTIDEVKLLQSTNVAIHDVSSAKESGTVGLFWGRQASKDGFLVVQARENRRDVADLYRLPLEAMREDPSAGAAPKVRLIKIDGDVEFVLESFIRRQIDRAVSQGANLLIFEIDSPGGLMIAGENLANAIADLDPKQVRTVAYIRRQALSMAAVIALACDEIYMHPDARIGDAQLIEIRPGQPAERVPEKLVSPFRTTLRTLARKKNRPPALVLAMSDRNLLVYRATHRDTGRTSFMSEAEIKESNGQWIQGPLVPETQKEELLTVDGSRAHQLSLTQAPVEDIDELKERLGIPAETRLTPVGRTWVDTLVFVLNTPFAMFLLITLGIVFIYLELHFMTGLLGILSALCFGLFFWSRFLGGTAGYLELVLFLLGLACIAMEVFVIPGFGVFGVSGGLLILGSLILAAHTFSSLTPTSNMEAVTHTVGTLLASVFCVIAAAMALNRFLPRIPLLNQMILTPPGGIDDDDPDSPRLRPEYTLMDSSSGATSEYSELVGQRGVASSVLRPAGKAHFGEHYLDVISDGPYITAGSEIEVLRVNGNTIIVRKLG